MTIAGIPVLYEDDDLLIIDKPGGMLTHPHRIDRESPDCISVLAPLYENRLYAVHRLDRVTSGILVFAKNRDAAIILNEQFREGGIEKVYAAIVRGHITEEFTIDRPVRRHLTGNHVPARSHIIPRSRCILPVPLGPYGEAWYSFITVYLETGRSNQARKHLHAVSHPIIGDKKYGDNNNNRYFEERFGHRETFLRAVRLSFIHPVSARTLRVAAGFPERWRNTLTSLGLEPDAPSWRSGHELHPSVELLP